ncbi:DUF397 domain-containing protein [Saccharopolyspora phatthalungensis]|uniref:DUF397 domain-containing protein n=1 Tax=Saccharopolyspora phatthalungensis TaxID=664693 RepID=UPI001622907A|nr:DUF397 domain-containing protein [Saccharopolyspora phatthalungensis]
MDRLRGHAGRRDRSVPFCNCAKSPSVHPDAVAVRDSKDRDGPVLAFPAASWGAFLILLADR